MAIIINIDVMLAKRKMSVTELAEKVGITMANISVLKNGKAKAIRLSTSDPPVFAQEVLPAIRGRRQIPFGGANAREDRPSYLRAAGNSEPGRLS